MSKKSPQRPALHRLHAGRIAVAALVLSGLTLSFLVLPGQERHDVWPDLQLIPALLALNVGAVVLLLLLTLLFGRVYCSLLCPLGIVQDLLSRLSGSRRGKEHRFGYHPAHNWLRYSILALFAAFMVAGTVFAVAGALPAAGLLEPYSAFGRIIQNLVSPLCMAGNNALAWLAKQLGSDWFREVPIWVRSGAVFGIAQGTFLLIALLAWFRGRAYCNTLCPVGALLSLISRWSVFGPRINPHRCVSCGLCAKKCKASCINPAEHKVDASRCVSCMNCLEACSRGAITYGLRWGYKGAPEPPAPMRRDVSQLPTCTMHKVKPEKKAPSPARRNFLMGSGMVLATAAARQKEKLVDGGLAPLVEKEVPQRRTHIVPPGAKSHRHFASHCTGCQLCVAACPNGVLRPSATLERLMQPECSYERGYCRPECTRCSEVCPAEAIKHITDWHRGGIQVGHAVWVRQHCVAVTDGVRCGNCARHCPTGAITMVHLDAHDPASPEIPVVNDELCIGCGACEHLCPARPHSAIYVEGHEVHRTI